MRKNIFLYLGFGLSVVETQPRRSALWLAYEKQFTQALTKLPSALFTCFFLLSRLLKSAGAGGQFLLTCLPAFLRSAGSVGQRSRLPAAFTDQWFKQWVTLVPQTNVDLLSILHEGKYWLWFCVSSDSTLYCCSVCTKNYYPLD